MDTIKVNKTQLLVTLGNNREQHRAMFLTAQERYKAKWIELLEQRLAEARDGGVVNRYVSLPEPEDHTADFDTAIEMLNWELGDEIEIDRRDFARFVQNQWEWDRSFAANTGVYLAE